MTEIAIIEPGGGLSAPPPSIEAHETLDDENHATRQEKTRRACVSMGIDWPETILPEGTALYASGLERLRSDRRLWASKPRVGQAVPVVVAALEAEDRKDYAVEVSQLRLREDNGRVASTEVYQDPKVVGFGYSPHAFRQLLGGVPGLRPGEAPRGTAGVLLHLSDAERARLVNARIGASDATLTLRTKVLHSGQRALRAALSTKYADLPDEGLAATLGELFGDARANVRLDYKPGDGQSRFELIFPSELPIETFRVGDVHYATIQVRNSDTGEGSLVVRPAVLRARCANLTLSTGEGVATRLVHVGDKEALRGKLRAALLAAEAQLAPLVAAIQRSAKAVLPYQPGDLIERLAKALQVSAERAKDWKETLETRYLPEAGLTAWSLSAAITEAAQRAPHWLAQEKEELVAARVTEAGVSWLQDRAAVEALR